jgi:putative oxidoreductase
MNNDCCATWAPRVLSLLRIVSGYLFLLHGAVKLFVAQMPLASLMGVAGIIELVGGILILLGLFSRVAAFICSGEMAFAYFMGHVAAKGHLLTPVNNGGDAAILFCFVFLYIAAAGPGPWSIDHLRNKA